MRMFWTMFFLGSMLLVGLDLREQRTSPSSLDPTTGSEMTAYSDPFGAPTPRP